MAILNFIYLCLYYNVFDLKLKINCNQNNLIMNKVFIVETCLTPGYWDHNSKVYLSEEKANDVALKIMDASNKKILARVTELNVVK